MPVRLEFDPDAAREVEAIHDWYEQRQPGFGADFVAQLDQDLGYWLRRLKRHPRP